MDIANLNQIKKLLNKVTAYKISKNTGIGETTISRWKTGKTSLKHMSFENAIKLTEYADDVLTLEIKNTYHHFFEILDILAARQEDVWYSGWIKEERSWNEYKINISYLSTESLNKSDETQEEGIQRTYFLKIQGLGIFDGTYIIGVFLYHNDVMKMYINNHFGVSIDFANFNVILMRLKKSSEINLGGYELSPVEDLAEIFWME